MDMIELAYDIYCSYGKIDFTLDGIPYRIQAEDSEVYLLKGENILQRMGNIQKAIQFLISTEGVELL